MAVLPEQTQASTNNGLQGLADPTQYTGPISLGDWSGDALLSFLQGMLTIRRVEEVIGDLATEGLARAPCHLGIGQEAVAVGVSTQLRRTDRVFGGHRSHSHYLALGGEIYPLFAEVLGRADGASCGMGGSMHLVDRARGFYGSVPLVGATIPIAVGAALAAKMDRGTDVAVAYFGDGAAEEGVFHESLNLAAAHGLPILFVCENNLFSSHLDISLRQPSDRISRFAQAHCMPWETIDGNDVVGVSGAARRLVEHSRRGLGPVFLEAVTYRHRGHVGPKEDVDVGVRRRLADIEAWKKRDPITRLQASMMRAGLLDSEQLEQLRKKIDDAVAVAVSKARAAPFPPASALLDRVYAGSRGR